MNAYREGFDARQEGTERGENPYIRRESPRKWGDWDDGWLDGEAGESVQICDPRSEKDSLKQCGS